MLLHDKVVTLLSRLYAFEDQIMISGKKDMSFKWNCLYLILMCNEAVNTFSLLDE